MGRIVINETENKQTVILNDSPEEITGGYFDKDMIWTDLGGPKAKRYKLKGSRTISGTGITMILVSNAQTYNFNPATGFNNPVMEHIYFNGGASLLTQIACVNDAHTNIVNQRLIEADGTISNEAYLNAVFEFIIDERFMTEQASALFNDVFEEVTE